MLIFLLNFLSILGLIVVGVLIYLVLLEVPLNFLNGVIEDKVFHNKATLDEVHLKWDYTIKKPVIVFKGLKYNNKEAHVAFNFKALGVSFDVMHLVSEHKFYPIYIYLDGFQANLTREVDNTITFQAPDYSLQRSFKESHFKAKNKHNLSSNDQNSKDTPTSKLNIVKTISAYKKKYPILALLNDVGIKNTSININDLGHNQTYLLNVPDLFLHYQSKQRKLQVKVQANLQEARLMSQPAHLTLDAYLPSSNKLYFNVLVSNAELGEVLKCVQPYVKSLVPWQIQGLDTNLALEGFYNLNNANYASKAMVTTQDGEIENKTILAQPLEVHDFTVGAEYANDTKVVVLKRVKLNLKNRTGLALQALKGAALPFDSLSLKGTYNLSDKTFKYENTSFVLAQHMFNTEGVLSPRGINTSVYSPKPLNIHTVGDLWPEALATEGRNWVMSNIKQGDISQLRTHVEVDFTDKTSPLKKLQGSSEASSLVIDYLHPMPLAYAQVAHLSFDPSGLIIDYEDAASGGLQSPYGRVAIVNSNHKGKKFLPDLELKLHVKAKAEDVLSFINQKPLSLLKSVNFDFSKISGRTEGDVALSYSFPNHKVHDIDIKTLLNNVVVEDLYKGESFLGSDLNLHVTDKKLTLYGNGSFYHTPLSLYSDINWDKKEPYSVKLTVEANDVEIEKVKNLGYLPGSCAKMLQGSFNGAVELKVGRKNKGEKTITANVDLTNTSISKLPYDLYKKSPQVSLNVTALINLQAGGQSFAIDQINVAGKNIDAQGRISFDKAIGSTNVIIDTFSLANLAEGLKGYLYISPTDFNATLRGKYLNVGKLKSVLSKGKKDKSLDNQDAIKETTNTQKDGSTHAGIHNFAIKLTIDDAESNRVAIRGLYINLALYHNHLYNLIVSGQLQDKYNLTVLLDKKRNTISYNVENLESLINFFGSSSAIKGGNLAGQAVFSQNSYEDILTDGNAVIRNFSLETIPFSRAELKFASNNLLVTILKLNLKGSALAANLRGHLDFSTEEVLLTGTVVPMWKASHFLMNIPLLSDFLGSNFAQNIISGRSGKTMPQSAQGVMNLDFSIFGNITKKINYAFKPINLPLHSYALDYINNLQSVNPMEYVSSIKDSVNLTPIDSY